jgi:GT2 family glycosyltransferase
VSWNAKSDLRKCLKSLELASTEFETVVVDNASSDGSAEMVAMEFPSVRLIRSETNTGFSGGNNIGLADLDCDYAFLLNSDATVAPGDLDELIAFADATPAAGIIGPRVINPDGSIQYSCRRWPTFEAGMFRNVWLGRLFPNNKPASSYLMQDFDHRSIIDVDWVSGCALFISKDCIKKIGLLDAETFFMYCEDMDWCLSAHKHHFRVVYFPGCEVTHAIGKSSDNAAERMILEHSRSMWKFYQKHREFFATRIPSYLKPLIWPGIWLRAYVRILKRRLTNAGRKDWRK